MQIYFTLDVTTYQCDHMTSAPSHVVGPLLPWPSLPCPIEYATVVPPIWSKHVTHDPGVNLRMVYAISPSALSMFPS